MLLSELPALGDGWDVGAVAGDDGFEDVARFGDVVGFGNGEDEVLLFSAGHRDVQAAAGGCWGGQGDAAGLGGGAADVG